jgi:hypothetical protein
VCISPFYEEQRACLLRSDCSWYPREEFQNRNGLWICRFLGSRTSPASPRNHHVLMPCFLLPSFQSQACAVCGPHQQLGSKTSSTFDATNAKAFQVTYGQLHSHPFPFCFQLTHVTKGTGQVAGVTIRDDVDLAGIKLKNLKVIWFS